MKNSEHSNFDSWLKAVEARVGHVWSDIDKFKARISFDSGMSADSFTPRYPDPGHVDYSEITCMCGSRDLSVLIEQDLAAGALARQKWRVELLQKLEEMEKTKP